MTNTSKLKTAENAVINIDLSLMGRYFERSQENDGLASPAITSNKKNATVSPVRFDSPLHKVPTAPSATAETMMAADRMPSGRHRSSERIHSKACGDSTSNRLRLVQDEQVGRCLEGALHKSEEQNLRIGGKDIGRVLK